MSNKTNNEEYTVDSIQVLDDIQHIRLRKGMYIGETYDPHHLFSEAFDNAIDEAQSGNSDLTIIKKFKDENGKLHYYVRDHGRGIPIGKILYGEKEVEALQILFTKCNSGAKFSSDNYRICSGTHGVGGVCICALSEWMRVTTIRDHRSVSLVTEFGEVKDLVYSDTDEENGVEIEFIPDPSEFESSEIPDSFIIDRCEVAQAMGYPVDLFINDKKIEIKINSLLDLIHLQPDVTEYCSDVIKVKDESTGESFIVGFKYTSDTKYRINGYTNLLYNSYGGTHTRCTIDAVTQAWSKYTEERSLVWDDCLLGMKIVVAAFIDNIAFSSQTKDKLTVPKSQLKTLTDLLSLKFEEWIESHKDLCTKLLDRFSEYRAAQRKLESQKEIMNVVQISKKDKSGRLRRGSSVVSSLIDCTSPSKEDTELYICLAGDTKIKMLDGTSPTLEELTERYKDPDEEFWVYSCDDSGEFIPAKAHNPRLTRYVDELYEISLSDGTIVKCTGNHKFMNRETMDWIRTDEMTVGTSLHHLSFGKTADGRCTVFVNKDSSYKEEPVYRIIGNLFYKEEHDRLFNRFRRTGDVLDRPQLHHKNCNKFDDRPENIECITQREHWDGYRHGSLSSQRITDYNRSDSHKRDMKIAWSNPELRKRMSVGGKHTDLSKQKLHDLAVDPNSRVCAKTWSETYNNSEKHHIDLITRFERFPNLKEKYSQRTSEMNKNPQIKRNQMRGRIGKIMRALFDRGLEFSEESWNLVNSQLHHSSVKYSTILKYFDSYEEACKFGQNWNYKVVSIKRISSPHTPVYCMTVDSTHRFALENGLISKNCEGLSASGSIARPRNKEFQAVLPLRGKIKNIAGYSLKDALKFETVANIVNSIGCGIGESADPEKSRYEKIIISADKDSDGSHIVALVLTAIVNLLPSIVKAGMVYILDAPFYKYWTKDGKHHYTSDFNEVPQWSFDNHKFLRFKGLGSMDDSDFKDACLNAENRVLFQVEYPDDLERFNHLAGTSAGRNELLSHYGVIRSISDLEEDESVDEDS